MKELAEELEGQFIYLFIYLREHIEKSITFSTATENSSYKN